MPFPLAMPFSLELAGSTIGAERCKRIRSGGARTRLELPVRVRKIRRRLYLLLSDAAVFMLLVLRRCRIPGEKL
jgi:hypothetical protein